MINRVTLVGRLGSDPEIRTLENGVQVGRFGLATSENYRDKSGEWQEMTEWHDVVVWRQAAERAQRTLFKGTLLYVEGKLTHRKWQDKEGNNRKTTEVVANYFRIMNRPADQQHNASNYGGHQQYATAAPGSTPASSSDAPAPAPSTTPANPAPASPAGPIQDDGEELPF